MMRHPAYVGAMVVTGLSMLILVYFYPGLPDPLPVHFSGEEPTTIRPKSILTVFSLVLTALAVLIGIRIMASSPSRLTTPMSVRAGISMPYSRSLALKQRRRLEARNRGLSWVALGASCALAFLSLSSVLPSLSALSRWSMLVAAATLFAGMLAMVNIMVRERRLSLDSIDPDEDEFARAEILVAHPQLWRPGGFYLNPADPMPMVTSKHDAMSFDYNYAHPAGRQFLQRLIGIVGVIFVVIVLWSIPV